MKWPFVLTLTWFQLYSLWYSYQPPESVGGFFYPTFFNIIHYCAQFEESACNPKKQLACCAFFWRSYAYTLVSELLLLLLRFRSWILRNTKTWALLCGKSHAEKKNHLLWKNTTGGFGFDDGVIICTKIQLFHTKHLYSISTWFS